MRPPHFNAARVSAVGTTADGTLGLLDPALARRMCDSSPLGILLIDAKGICTDSNAACHHITGLTLSQTLGQHWVELLHEDDRAQAQAQWSLAGEDDPPIQTELRLRDSDAGVTWVSLSAAAVRGASNAWMLMIEDVSERKASETALRVAEQALFEEKERAQVTLRSIGDAVLVTDRALNVTYINPEAVRLTGWSSEEATGRSLSEVLRILDGDTLQAARNPARQAIDEDRTVELALGCLLMCRDGYTVPIEDSAAPIHNRDGSVGGAVIVFHDAAQSRTMVETNAHLARHDALTGLANAALLTERLSHAIALARRHRRRLALLYIDMDQFKEVNDAHGHLVGDQLLKSVGTRMQRCVRASDTVCRRGGDEFVVLLEDLECREDAVRAASKIHAALCEPHLIDGIAVASSASIGISVYPDDGEDATILLRRADREMYQSKAVKPARRRRAPAAAVASGSPIAAWVAMRAASSSAPVPRSTPAGSQDSDLQSG